MVECSYGDSSQRRAKFFELIDRNSFSCTDPFPGAEIGGNKESGDEKKKHCDGGSAGITAGE